MCGNVEDEGHGKMVRVPSDSNPCREQADSAPGRCCCANLRSWSVVLIRYGMRCWSGWARCLSINGAIAARYTSPCWCCWRWPGCPGTGPARCPGFLRTAMCDATNSGPDRPGPGPASPSPSTTPPATRLCKLPDTLPDPSGASQRRRDPGWREAIIHAWDRQCAFCGYDGQVLGDRRHRRRPCALVRLRRTRQP